MISTIVPMSSTKQYKIFAIAISLSSSYLSITTSIALLSLLKRWAGLCKQSVIFSLTSIVHNG